MTLISRLVFFNHKKTLSKSSARIKTTEISIVVPVKDNQQGINNYLENFLRTHLPEDYPKELILVDNNSSPPLVIDERYHSENLKIKLLRCEKPGPAAARNLGAKHALGEWILFNDSDCIPTNCLLSGYLQSDNLSIAYAGNVKSVGTDRLSRYYETQEILLPLKTYNYKGEFVPQYLITANALIWRDAFIEVNGFNENIHLAGGEDVDLGLRLSQVGDLAYAFESVVLHDFNDGWKGFYKRFKRYGEGNKIVARLWQTNLRPRIFRPNKRTLFNEFAAKLQYVFLLIGYLKSTKITD